MALSKTSVRIAVRLRRGQQDLAARGDLNELAPSDASQDSETSTPQGVTLSLDIAGLDGFGPRHGET